jgi:hypothetical protein
VVFTISALQLIDRFLGMITREQRFRPAFGQSRGVGAGYPPPYM